MSLRAGATVKWVNADDEPHTVTGLPSSDSEFDSGRLRPGERFEKTFTDIGKYQYVSTTDREMRGTVSVLWD